MTYYTLSDPCAATLEIKKSQFLGFGFAIDSREQLMFHVEQLRNQYPDARHVCYGYMKPLHEQIHKSSLKWYNAL